MLKRAHIIALSSVILLVLIFLNLPSQTTTQVKLALGSLFLPLFGFANSTQKLAENAGNSVVPRRVLVRELEELRKENQRLKLQLMQNNQIWQENNQLRQALKWQQQRGWKVRLAAVVSRDPANWWRTIQIDLGSRDGVVTNLAVMTSEGLVGRVEEVGFTSSRVVLLGDPTCRVASIVEETRDTGVIAAGGAAIPDQLLIEMTYLSRHSQAKPGNRVVTSGLGGIFPKGILVGHVADISTVGHGLYLEARVKLAANLKQLEQVWILFP
ncbi:MAG: rod shape-determining protein MreC [Verrucomicrobiota bacterium]|nr:rod shape-determining protein MreC [Verrucomicrobiota bacterium]